jgi:ATP-dependent DNA helicase PIF1
MAFSNKNKEKIEKGIKNDDIISETIMETEKDEIIVPLMNRINTVSKQKNALEILEKYKYKKDPINSKSGLSEKQQKAFELMKAGDNIFLTGTAGSGKSHIIKLYVSTFRSSLNIGLTSTTGVSAILIGGTTLHSFLGIGLAKEDVTNLYLKIKRNPFIYKRWKTLDVLIIDEVSMLSPTLLDKLDKLAKSLRRNSNPFGGIQVILTGDFLQLPVVGEKDAFCFDAECWESLIPKQNIICLTENFRQNNDSTFREILNELRYGILSDNSYKILKNRENVVLTNEHGILATKIFSLNSSLIKILRK